MKIMLLFLVATAPAFAAKAPLLPKDLEDFLGASPPRFEQKFRAPARELKAALEQLHGKKIEAGLKKLSSLSSGTMAEHAAFELAMAYREHKDFTKSAAQAEKLLRYYPGSIYGDRARELIEKNECDQGLAAKKDEAVALLQRCLWRTSWKNWDELEAQASALYTHLKNAKDPLLDAFVAELIQAMPPSTALRKQLVKEIPNEKLESLATMARQRSKSVTPAGVKAVNPDLELFDSGMKLVLSEEWSDANAIFRRLPTEFPQSEHGERAQFWIARTEEKLGHKDEAKKRFEQILAENPFTYYGLQAALYLKHDWNAALSVPPQPLEKIKFAGNPLTRQAISLWKLRALLEVGAIDSAREEARFLFQLKPGGSTLGQSEAPGALMMARLFGESGHHMAAFSHAYAAVSLNPTGIDSNIAGMIFPRPYLNEFNAAAEKSGIHPALLLSVAKQESAFLPNAYSRADAFGLMQLIFPTAREMVPGISREALYEPATSTKIGALYLQKLLLRFEGNIAFALAAYNAGPNRAAAWHKDLMQAPLMKAGLDPDAFIDSIPYTETRKYVANILRNFAWYKLLAKDGTIGSIQELMYQWQKPQTNSPSEVKASPAMPGPVKPGT